MFPRGGRDDAAARREPRGSGKAARGSSAPRRKHAANGSRCVADSGVVRGRAWLAGHGRTQTGKEPAGGSRAVAEEGAAERGAGASAASARAGQLSVTKGTRSRGVEDQKHLSVAEQIARHNHSFVVDRHVSANWQAAEVPRGASAAGGVDVPRPSVARGFSRDRGRPNLDPAGPLASERRRGILKNNSALAAVEYFRDMQKEQDRINASRTFRSVLRGWLFDVIVPSRRWKQHWDMVVILAVIYGTITLPILVAYELQMGPGWLEYLVDCVFIIDIYFCFRTAFVDEWGILVLDAAEIKRNYVATWFFWDLAASLPLDFIIVILKAYVTLDRKALRWLGLLKIYRLLRIGRIFKMLKNVKYANALRIVRLFLGLITVTHLLGCLWQVVNLLETGESWMEGTADPFDDFSPQLSGMDVGERYVHNMYTMMLALIGEDIGPVTDAERAILIFFLLMGSVMTAVIFGNVAALIASLGARDAACRAKMDAIRERMRFLKISRALQDKVQHYYEYLFITRGGMEENLNFFADLSPPLHAEVNWHLHRDVLQKLPFFRGITNASDMKDIVHRIAVTFTTRVFMPLEMIYTEGEMALECMIIAKGKVRILSIRDGMELCYLRAGAIFGETALMKDKLNGEKRRRETSARSETFSDVYVTTREIFERVSMLYHDFGQNYYQWLNSRRLALLGSTVSLWMKNVDKSPEAVVKRFVVRWRARRAARVHGAKEFEETVKSRGGARIQGGPGALRMSTAGAGLMENHRAAACVRQVRECRREIAELEGKFDAIHNALLAIAPRGGVLGVVATPAPEAAASGR